MANLSMASDAAHTEPSSGGTTSCPSVTPLDLNASVADSRVYRRDFDVLGYSRDVSRYKETPRLPFVQV